MKLKPVLKKLLPESIICRLKLGWEGFYFAWMIRKLEKSGQSVDFLLGTPVHTNLGDHLIAMAERNLLDRFHYTRKIVEIPTEVYQIYKKRLRKIADKNSVIFINGGGWMGNLWPVEELLLQDMVGAFPGHKIIIFPQTVFYDKAVKPYESLIVSARKLMEQNPRLYLFVRDRQSYEFAREQFNSENIYLCPDAALSYCLRDTDQRVRPKTVGFCLREDRERSRERQKEQKIRAVLKQMGYREVRVSTMSFFRVPSCCRKAAVHKRLLKFFHCSLIVTDRLHGMIFAYITKTPCVILDNKTGKVFGVYREWLSDVDWIYPVSDSVSARNIESFVKAAEAAKSLEKPDSFHFDILREIVIHG